MDGRCFLCEENGAVSVYLGLFVAFSEWRAGMAF